MAAAEAHRVRVTSCRCGQASREEVEEEVTDSPPPAGSEEPEPPPLPVSPTRGTPAQQNPQGDPQRWDHNRARTALNKVGDPSEKLVDVGPLGVSGTQSDSAIILLKIRSREKLFYGAHIGSETRNVEFKRGGGEYLRHTFRSHLRRYACAFLNSGGGSLLVGVDDGGVVRGIGCDHRQEDAARLLVDSVLKSFRPPLLPHCYSLTFVPVMRPGPEGVALKVLRLTLRPPEGPMSLYETDQGEVYLRRDGSVEGPLSAAAIQEWARQRWSGEVSRLQQFVEALLTEQHLLLQELQQQCMLISSLQNSKPRSRQRPPLAAMDRLSQGALSSRAVPCHAGGRQCACCGPALSVGPAQVGVDWAGPYNVNDRSPPGRESLNADTDEGPEAHRGWWRRHRGSGGQEDRVSVSSICCTE